MRARGHALTQRFSIRARVIPTPCEVCAAFDPATTPQHEWPATHRFEAIWDTGATGSVITQAVVDACGLKATGMIKVNHAGGVDEQETYLINIVLINGVQFPSVKVTKAPLTATPMLIGMDIISMGDFAITNKDGLTIFTFRVPSTGRFDFVREENRLGTPAAGNAVITNKKNKKKKKHR